MLIKQITQASHAQRRARAPTADACLVPMSEVTANLDRAAAGDAGAADKLLPLVYEELRQLAAFRMSNERETSTLQPTALVHEAWLRLVGQDKGHWDNRGHFFAAAAEAMRRILIERARRKLALKRGTRPEHINLDSVDVAITADEDSLVAMNEALERLTLVDASAAELVKLRFFVGLSYEEAALVMGVSERTAKRCWSFARAWLYRDLSKLVNREP